MSNASEVYTRLGEDAVETWTSLWKSYQDGKKRMKETRDQHEIDRCVKEIQALGTQLNRIEEQAGIPAQQRTS